MGKESNIVGYGYYQRGYGRGFKKGPAIRLIGGKLYAKDSKASDYTPLKGELAGYTRINAFIGSSGLAFSQTTELDHQEFKHGNYGK